MTNRNSKLDLLERQFKSAAFPHAYLFSGSDEKTKADATTFVLNMILGLEYARSPDFMEINQNPITIDEIRFLKARAYETPLIGGKKVFLIKNIENLSRDAAPAMLKILEEPPANTIILAETAKKNAVLATIKSRFSEIRFTASGGLDPDSTICYFEKRLRNNLNRANAGLLERAIWVENAMLDQTINKRLLGEYLGMLKSYT